jgi:serine/threonine protein kinase
MDYCDIGSVRDMIELCNKPLKEDQIAYILQQSLQGLLYLHSMNIIHRDVKVRADVERRREAARVRFRH